MGRYFVGAVQGGALSGQQHHRECFLVPYLWYLRVTTEESVAPTMQFTVVGKACQHAASGRINGTRFSGHHMHDALNAIRVPCSVSGRKLATGM